MQCAKSEKFSKKSFDLIEKRERGEGESRYEEWANRDQISGAGEATRMIATCQSLDWFSLESIGMDYSLIWPVRGRVVEFRAWINLSSFQVKTQQFSPKKNFEIWRTFAVKELKFLDRKIVIFSVSA